MHSYRIAVDKSLIPPRPKHRIPFLSTPEPEVESKTRSPKIGWERRYPVESTEERQSPTGIKRRSLRNEPEERTSTLGDRRQSPRKKSKTAPSKKSLSSKDSNETSIFSNPARSSPGTQITEPSVQRTTPSKKRTAQPTVVDRFAIDLVERSNTLQLNGLHEYWMRKREIAKARGPTPIEFYYPAFYRSLRICTTAMNGNPVHMTSEQTIPSGLSSLRVGEALFLNNQASGDKIACISIQPGDNGRPRFMLELSMLLVTRAKGEVKFTCEASMDITEMMRTLCNALFARYFAPGQSRHDHPISKRYADGSFWLNDVDWDEQVQESMAASFAQNAQDFTPTLALEIPHTDADLIEFHEQINDIKGFHRDCFILERSASQPTTWSIADMSTALHEKLPEVEIGMSPSHPDTLRDLGMHLVSTKPFSLSIRWGKKAEKKWLHCVPMFRSEKPTCWMCFLTTGNGVNVSELWASQHFLETWSD